MDGQEKDVRNGVRTKVSETVDISFDLAAAASAAAGAPPVDESGRALTAAQKAEIEKANKEQARHHGQESGFERRL